MLPSLRLALVLLCAFAPAALSDISVTGVTDKSYHLNAATWSIQHEAGFTYTATVDGDETDPAGSHVEDRLGYHELMVTKTPVGGGPPETVTLRFIVKDSQRGGSSNTYAEAGLARWTPFRSVDAPGSVLDAVPTVDIITPSHLPPGFKLPIIARLLDGAGSIVRLMGTIDVYGGGFPTAVRLFRGAGSKVIDAPGGPGSHPLTLSLGSRTIVRQLTVEAAPAWQSLSGVAGGVTFAAGSFIDVTGDVSVPANQTLTIGPGCVVQCAQGAGFDIQGVLAVNGSAADPVVFGPAPNAVWGGIWIHGTGSSMNGRFLILTGGGADPNWIEDHSMHSHKSEEPLVTWTDGAGGSIEDCYIVDNPAGQSLHAEDSNLTVRRCLLQRAVAGGQIHDCTLTWEHTHLVEMPVDDPVITADIASADHDGLYVDGGVSVISHSVFGWCKDDGIDAGSGNSSNVTVDHCWFEACLHEGMAWSEGGSRTVTDSVVINNGQGIECGFTGHGAGTPIVNVLRLYATGNLNGIRYGDNYDWDYSGKFEVHDSLLLFNTDDVFGRHWGEFVGTGTIDWNYAGADRAANAYLHLEAVPSLQWGPSIVSSPQPEHPELPLWNPGDPDHLARLTPFIDLPGMTSGFGVANDQRLRPRAGYGGAVTVRLDRPSDVTRIIPWKLIGKVSPSHSAGMVLATGELTIPAGSQWASITPPVVSGAGAMNLLALVFEDTAGCLCTGGRSVTWIDPDFATALMDTIELDGLIQILWTADDLILQRTADLASPWQDLPEARAPFAVVTDGPRMFYRLRRR